MPISQELMQDLDTRRGKALAGGGAAKTEERNKKGILTARQRLEVFYDPGTFTEFGLHVRHRCTGFGMADKEIPADGVITGVGMVNGHPVAAFAQDFTVAGGSLGEMHARKLVDLMQYALKCGMPVVGVNDSGGARIQEAVNSLSGYGEVFYNNVLLSGVVPQIAVIAGPCAGGGAYSPALCDFLIMTRNANMFICGPEVIKAVTGQAVTMDEIGSAAAHATISGNIHFVANDDRHAMQLSQQLLSYLPPNNMSDPPHHLDTALPVESDVGMDVLVPENPKDPIDAKAVIARLVDDGISLEVQADWAKNIITSFARIGGVVVGIVANNPMVKAGTLDIDTSDKAARFIRTCNVYNIPLISLVDVPGFLPGKQQEQGGIIRHGAKMLFAWASATVPKITVIMRKAYGGAYLAMCSRDMGADLVFAWPCAEIAVMGADGAVNVLFKDQIKAASDPNAKRKELVTQYKDMFASPWQAAHNNMIADVIAPNRTRAVVAQALRITLPKRETRPPKKHGNIAM
jgi:propionyl-CoA carboxylase beta chain